MSNHTTTDYGTWNNFNRSAATPKATVLDAMAGGGIDWIMRMDAAGYVDDITSEYVDAINEDLAHIRVRLCGDQFIGPYPYPNDDTTPHPYPGHPSNVIQTAIDRADEDLGDVIESYDVDAD